MAQVFTNLITRESARRERVEPNAAAGGSISATNVQKALEGLDGGKAPNYPGPTSVAASYPVSNTDVEVQIDTAGGAYTITLPAASTWTGGTKNGLPLVIKDVTGHAQANNVTINRQGADVIDGATSLMIGTNFGGWSLRPLKSGGGWTVV